MAITAPSMFRVRLQFWERWLLKTVESGASRFSVCVTPCYRQYQFEDASHTTSTATNIQSLHAKIGELKLDNDFRHHGEQEGASIFILPTAQRKIACAPAREHSDLTSFGDVRRQSASSMRCTALRRNPKARSIRPKHFIVTGYNGSCTRLCR